jgi:trehalose/maltose hydrolase-like predicted phosphorylase
MYFMIFIASGIFTQADKMKFQPNKTERNLHVSAKKKSTLKHCNSKQAQRLQALILLQRRNQTIDISPNVRSEAL